MGHNPMHVSLGLAEEHAGERLLRVAGVLSGTSADGIDVGLAELRVRPGKVEPPRLEAFGTLPFESGLADRLRRALDGAPTGLRQTALLHRDLGRAFGDAAAAFAGRHGFPLDLVASHGQTVWHHDGDPSCGPGTLQLGDADHVAAACGAPVVSDFRQAELAAGGQGAPLSGYADGLVFAAAERPLAVLNLGGMGNLTYLWGAEEASIAFDTGPAGALLDGLARRVLGEPMDRGGGVAAQGQVLQPLVDGFLEHPFFAESLPRSTGRDTFGEEFVAGFLGQAEALCAAASDLLASAVECVAASVARGLADHLPAPPAALWVAGGGVHHGPLMGALARKIGIPVRSVRQLGVNPDAREALVFAVLGARFVAGEPVSVSLPSGPRQVVLGRWSPAPRL